MIKSMFSSAYAWLRRNSLVLFAVAVVYITISKRFGVADTIVSKILCFALSSIAVHWIDKQLPRHRWRTLTILLLAMAVIFISFGIYRFAIKQLPLGDEVWIFGIMILLSGGYGIYALWRWRAQMAYLMDVKQRRKIKAHRGA